MSVYRHRAAQLANQISLERAQELQAEGMGYKRIYRILNAENLKNSIGRPWSREAVRLLLKRNQT